MACLRILRTGCSCDSLDDGARMEEEIIRSYFRDVIWDMITIYRKVFLNRRQPSTGRSRATVTLDGV